MIKTAVDTCATSVPILAGVGGSTRQAIEYAQEAPLNWETLTNVPFINGAGEAVVVTTDALGRQVSTSVPFYVTSTLATKYRLVPSAGCSAA